MKNPYDDILPPEKVKIGRKSAWGITGVFLLALVLPPLIGNVRSSLSVDKNQWVPAVEFFHAVQPAPSSSPTGAPGIVQRLREFETKLEENSDYAEFLRRGMQAKLTKLFREGNNRTVIGRDGWLYFRTALQALSGYGPMVLEPQSVAKDPSRAVWKPALTAMERFAGQLQERGIELVLVPAPVKPMIYPEHLMGDTNATAPIRHQDSEAFYDALRAAEITVIDAADVLWEMKGQDETEGPVFLKQDTHWRPRGMSATAEVVAEYLKARPWFQNMPQPTASYRTEATTASHIGDLVEKLDLPKGTNLFAPESAELTRVLDAATGQPIASDRQSPLVLLGDSFVNVFDDPGLGFAIDARSDSNGESNASAGFAQHLAMKLGRPLDVIAINGEASTGVRSQFARRYDDEVRAKKAVIWVIAARDLFLSETAAQGLVRWDDVTFSTALRPSQPILAGTSQAATVKGTITMKSPIENPRDSTYKDALFTIELEVTEIEDGNLPAERDVNAPLCVVLWAFKNRTYSQESNLKEGQEVRVKLVPYQTKTALQTTKVFDDSLLFDATQWFAEDAMEVK